MNLRKYAAGIVIITVCFLVIVPSGEASDSTVKASGPQKTIAILVEFADIKHAKLQTEIDNLIFGKMNSYWREVSYENIHITGSTTSWYTISYNMSYFGADVSKPGDEPNSKILIQLAVQASNKDVNFSGYQHITIVHAGNNQAVSSPSEMTDDIWSAHWKGLKVATNDGVTITHAIIISENDGLGAYAHEFGHSLGLPDLYDKTGAQTYVGDWSLMDTGCQLGKEKRDWSFPSHLEAWSKIMLGWLTPIVVSPPPHGLIQSLYPIASPSGPHVVKITLTSTTYYLIELRRKIGFDSSLPNEGLLVTLIDETKKTGEGIVRVISRNAANMTLDDAVFYVGQSFNDTSNNVFVYALSASDSSVVTVLSSKPLPITRPKLQVAARVVSQFSDITKLEALATNGEGNPMSNVEIIFEYFNGSTWSWLGRSSTSASGHASLAFMVRLGPGNYELRYTLLGGIVSGRFYYSTLAKAMLEIRKEATIVQIRMAKTAYAYDTIQCDIIVLDDEGTPVPSLAVHVYVDQVRRTSLITDLQGHTSLTLNFDLTSVGTHSVLVKVDGGAYYMDSDLSTAVRIDPPPWLYFLILLPVAVAAILVRKRAMSRKALSAN